LTNYRKRNFVLHRNTLQCKANCGASSKLVHWPLINGLLHLAQRGGDWGSHSQPRPLKLDLVAQRSIM